jgi:hypothetical protein
MHYITVMVINSETAHKMNEQIGRVMTVLSILRNHVKQKRIKPNMKALKI